MIVGCYTLDLYCDAPGHKNLGIGGLDAAYTGHTEGECKKKARRDGWRFTRNPIGRKCFCPECKIVDRTIVLSGKKTQ